jgi:ribonuclease HII
LERRLPDYRIERSFHAKGLAPVAGVDEAGRGPLAGPVACAAVILDPQRIPPGLDDSKKLSEARRGALFDLIMAQAQAVSVTLAPAAEIDRLNIRAATLAAMARALRGLALAPAFALIDGRDIPAGLPCPAEAVIGGDAKCFSIAAASIIAKVTRDRLMRRLDAHAPGYGFARHAGYGVERHRLAIESLGASPWHRMSFRPLRRD